MINRVTLIGNLGKEVESTTLESGVKVAKFSMATNESYKDKNGEWQTITTWINVVCWRGLADIAEKYFKKGSLVYVEGKLSNRSYQDKEGQNRYITEVVANVVRLLEKREGSNTNFPSEEPAERVVGGGGSVNKETLAVSVEPVGNAPDDNLPF